MTLKDRIMRPLFQSIRTEHGAQRLTSATAGGNRPFFDTLMECADRAQIEALSIQKAQSGFQGRFSPQASLISLAYSCLDALRRAFLWLQKRYLLRATKQLRVSETVSLGEKRFVAILHIDNQKFLIGGGASNVALLAQLEVEAETANSSASGPLPQHGVD